MLHFPSWLPHMGLQLDPGKEFHGAWEPSLLLFFPLFVSQAGADTPRRSGGTEGGAWPPNRSKSFQWGPATLGGLQWLRGLSSPCFVCPLCVPRTFGRLPPARLHCPVSSQPPGDRMWPGFGSTARCHTAVTAFVPVSRLPPRRGACSPTPSLPGSQAVLWAQERVLLGSWLLLHPSCRVVPQAEPALGCVCSPAPLCPPLCPRRGDLSAFGSQLFEATQF